ncbi:hypothetical protein FI667_g14021, partial [Globisporangium splendens]
MFNSTPSLFHRSGLRRFLPIMTPRDPARRPASASASPSSSPYESAADVPPVVAAAVAAFVPPAGFADFPIPTKNNLQRSLIYFFGRRVQCLATGKSHWFCLASPQCRANRTIISTAANISGCTRHLQVFHQLISPKTVHANRKARGQAPPQPKQVSILLGLQPVATDAAMTTTVGQVVEPQLPSEDIAVTSVKAVDVQNAAALHAASAVESPRQDQQQLQVSDRARALEWTMATVVRNLLPIALLVNDDRLQRLARSPLQSRTSMPLSEKRIQHHLAEFFDSAQSHLMEKIARELPLAAIPIFHLILEEIPVCRARSSVGKREAETQESFLALHVSFISSAFDHEHLTLDVKRFVVPRKNGEDKDTEKLTAAYCESVKRWIRCVLERLHLSKHHIQSFVADKSACGAVTSTLTHIIAADLGHRIESTCLIACHAAIDEAYSSSSDSHLLQLVTALQEFAACALDADFADLFQGVEADVQCVLQVNAARQRTSSFWRSFTNVLQRVGSKWEACRLFFLTQASSDHGSLPPRLVRDFTEHGIMECVSILQPLGRFFSELEDESGTESGGNSSPTCTEVILRMFALQQATFNPATPLQVTMATNSDGHASEERVAAMDHATLTEFARKLHEELATHWAAAIREKASPSSSSLLAIMCVFFHPCFRQLGLLDQQQFSINAPGEDSLDTKLLIHAQIKKYAREALQWKARLTSPPSGSPGGASEGDDDEDHSGSQPSLKRQKLARQEKLTRQAQELSRLGYLEVVSTPMLPDGIASAGDGSGDVNGYGSDWPAADLVISREIERYLQNESVAFCDVPFDKVLPYWQRKAFDYPTLALLAQAVLGHPASTMSPYLRANATQPEGFHTCVRCCFGVQSQLPWRKSIRDEIQAFEEMTLFLHLNEARLAAHTSVLVVDQVRELTDEAAARVVATFIAKRERERRPPSRDHLSVDAAALETPSERQEAVIQV